MRSARNTEVTMRLGKEEAQGIAEDPADRDRSNEVAQPATERDVPAVSSHDTEDKPAALRR